MATLDRPARTPAFTEVTPARGHFRRPAREPRSGVLGLVGRWGRWVGSLLRARWRRSLRLRVLVTTFVASGAVVFLLGIVLLDQFAHGVLQSQLKAAQSNTSSGVTTARNQLAAEAGAPNFEIQGALLNVGTRLSDRGGGGVVYDVWILPQSADFEAITPPNANLSAVPEALRNQIQLGNLAYQYVRLTPSDAPSTPGLVVGAPVSTVSGTFELYYVFPLTSEVATIALVRRIVVLAGFVLVLLLAAISWLVTRQVVTPVRAAARTASRLSAGLLDERMRVRGTDDLASLARSFNEMAGNLQHQIGALEELSRLQRRFTSDVSHELRTPLATVRMAADTMFDARAEFPPVVARTAELLSAEVDRFESLLVDLLEISRFDAGAATLDPELVDLRSLVVRAFGAVHGLAERNGVQVDIEQGAPAVVAEVDPRRVERILRNLLGNAIDHAEGGVVRVRVAGGEGAVAVTVRDHGVGLRTGDEDAVFERFWRADASRNRTTGGTGLGLSISLEDARLHGGWLEAWGAPGHGAQFRLTLPRSAGDELVDSPLPLIPEDESVPAGGEA